MPIIKCPPPPPLSLLRHRLSCSCCCCFLLLCLPPSTALDRSTWVEVQRMYRPTASFLLQVVDRHNVIVKPDVILDRANEHCEFVLSKRYALDVQHDQRLWLRVSWGEGKNESVFINPIHTDTAEGKLLFCFAWKPDCSVLFNPSVFCFLVTKPPNLSTLLAEAEGKTYVFGIYTYRAMVTVFQRGEGAARTKIGVDRVAKRFNSEIPSDDIYTYVVVMLQENIKVTAAILNNDTHLKGERITLTETSRSHKFLLSNDAPDLKSRQKVWLHLTEGEGENMQQVSINPIYTDDETTAEGRTYMFRVSRNRLSIVVFQRIKGAGPRRILDVLSVKEWGRVRFFPPLVVARANDFTFGVDGVAQRRHPRIHSADIYTCVVVIREDNCNVTAEILNNDNHLEGERITLNEVHPSHKFLLSEDAHDLKIRQKVWLHLTEGEGENMQEVSINPIYTDDETTAEGRTYTFTVSRDRISLAVFQRKKGGGNERVLDVSSVKEWGADDFTFVSVKMNTAPPLKVGLLNANGTVNEIGTLDELSALKQTTFCLSNDAEDLRRRQQVWLLVTRGAMGADARPMKIDPIGGDSETTAEGKTYFFEVYEHNVALLVFKHKKEGLEYKYDFIRRVLSVEEK